MWCLPPQTIPRNKQKHYYEQKKEIILMSVHTQLPTYNTSSNLLLCTYLPSKTGRNQFLMPIISQIFSGCAKYRIFLYYLVHQFFPIYSELLKQEALEIFDLIQKCTYTIWNPNMIMIPTLIFVYTFYSRLSHSMGSRIR